jgi:FkbM family methyltransferase
MDAADWEHLAATIRTQTAIVQLVAQTPEGMFLFDVRDLGVGWTLAQGAYEPIETALVKHLVKPGDLVVDAGANLGWYAAITGRIAGPSGLVLAFEPDALNRNFLEINLGANGVAGSVRIFGVALYERDTTIDFDVCAYNFGDHRIGGVGPASSSEIEPRERVQVAARSLDSVLTELALEDRPIGLFKIDTQGAEVAIFRGAPRALGRVKHMVAEFWPHGLERAGYGVDEYANIVSAHFSRFARLSSADIQTRPISEFQADIDAPPDTAGPEGFTNYLFLK